MNVATRMHSSRMRTSRSSSRWEGWGGGVCLSACWDRPSPQVWAWRPPWPDPSQLPSWASAWRPWPDPPQLPPCVWAWRPWPDPPQLPPWVWAWRPWPDPLNFPLGCGPGDTLGPIPLNFSLWCGHGDTPGQILLIFSLGSEDPPSQIPLGVGLETCKACWDTTPWRSAARHAGIPPAMHAGIPPFPMKEFLTHASENITLPQLRCGR